MNVLKQVIQRANFTRFFETFESKLSKSPRRLVIEALPDRDLVRVRGDEVVPFLQGLITNDMNHLQNGPNNTISMYTMFLNKAGRVLYDSIIYRTKEPNTYLIECDKLISKELSNHLQLYRVRRRINIDQPEKKLRPWIVFDADSAEEVELNKKRMTDDILYSNDPRVSELGIRLLTPAEKSWSDVAKIFAEPGEVLAMAPTQECNYRLHRYQYGIGEGVNDLPPGKCFPLEANCDFLHGVSFQKGCYIGQELTARVHHTGVIRKRLMPVRLSSTIPESHTTIQSLSGANVGSVRGSVFNRALALMRVEQVLNASELMIGGEPCYTEKPKWWPKEMPTKVVGSKGY